MIKTTKEIWFSYDLDGKNEGYPYKNTLWVSLDEIKKALLEHRKDQIIRNCVNPQLGKHILDSAMAKTIFTIKGLSKDHPAQRNFNEFMQKQKEVKSGCNANDDGIPPNNKLLGIYENRRSILKENSRTAKKETLKTYSDFYEWLQNNI